MTVLATFPRSAAPREAAHPPSPLASLSSASNGHADPAGFASLLQQSRHPSVQPPVPPPAPVKPAPAPPPAKPPGARDEAVDAGPQPQPQPADAASPLPTSPGTGPTATDGRIARDRLRASDGVGRPEHRTAPKEAKADETSEATEGNDEAASKDKPVASIFDTGQVQQQLVGTTRTVSRDGSSSDPGQAADHDPTTARGHTPLPGTDATDPKLAADARAGAAHPGGAAADAAAANPFAGVLGEQRRADAAVGSRSSGVALAADAVGNLAAASATASARAESAAAPAGVAITTPVDGPDFAQQLGLSLAVLARDGVQHAELTLNPADLGPVSVQIAVDGTQARVDFGADLAATRQAIEAGLPALAGALRDAGFTLAGGGVSDHAGSRGGREPGADGASEPRRFERVADEGVSRLATAARRAITRGGVDLFA